MMDTITITQQEFEAWAEYENSRIKKRVLRYLNFTIIFGLIAGCGLGVLASDLILSLGGH